MSQSLASEMLFIGLYNGRLQQWSIRLRKFIKNYGQIMDYNLFNLKRTPDKMHLFLSDNRGN
jgi:hypothetical protein